jgi:hypothetical protein
MPPLSTKTKHYHRERIRSLIVQNPHISDEGIRKTLELQGLPLDRHYIGSLLKAIHTERAKRADTWTLNMALASFQDAMAEIARVGWEIANDKFAPGRDRAAALKEVREAYNAVFEKLFDAGVFERKLGTLDAPRLRGVARQMFNLGVESHDDLNDALVYLLQGLVSQGLELPKIHWIEA